MHDPSWMQVQSHSLAQSVQAALHGFVQQLCAHLIQHAFLQPASSDSEHTQEDTTIEVLLIRCHHISCSYHFLMPHG